MLIRKASILAIAAAICFLWGCGRATVPIVDYNNVSFAKPPATLTLSQVRNAIAQAAQTRGWSIEDKGPGKVLARITVRNKHTVVVLVSYTTTSFSITYVSSTDMKYEVDQGVASIHPFYNKWVKNLEDDILNEIKLVSH